MGISEVACCLFSAGFLILFLYDKKRLTLLKMRKRFDESRNRKNFSEQRPSLLPGLSDKAVFIFSVLARKSLNYSESKINKAAALFLMINSAAFIVILSAGETIILRVLLLISVDLLLYGFLSEMSVFRFKKDVNKLVTGLQNVILQENEIITGAKYVVGKMDRSMLSIETEKILNELIKNSKYPEYMNFKLYLRKTLGYELPLIVSFLSGSCISGDRNVIKNNLRELEGYCSQTFESCKDHLFSKIPYIVLILMLPLFLIWMDAFSSEVIFSGAAAKEPKEYIYLFSGILAYLFLDF